MQSTAWLSVMLAIMTVTSACGPGSAGRAVRPDAPTAREALGQSSCTASAEYAEPLVVDWQAHERATLEEAMASGIAVVAHDCGTLRVLRDCHVDGSYGTTIVTRKDQVIELEDADEIRANLPSLGGKLALDLEGELKRGSSLSLAMVLLAKKRTTLTAVDRAQLRGSCDGATHFVRGAFVGAFAMGTMTRGKLRSVADVFGASASVESASSRRAHNTDGDPVTCSADVGSSTTPSGCSAVLRLELRSLSARSAETPTASTCPAPMVASNGKCVAATKPVAHVCKGDETDCTAQCDAGDAKSCAMLAMLVSGGSFGTLEGTKFHGDRATTGAVRAAGLLDRSCSAGFANACSNLGFLYESGQGVTKDEMRAVELYKRSCDNGDGGGCANLGAMYRYGKGGLKEDMALAIQYSHRACDAGQPRGCFNLGTFHTHGLGVPKDDAAAFPFYKRACDGKLPYGCALYGWALVKGAGAPVDRARGLASLRDACRNGNTWGCERLAELGEPK